MTADSRLLLLRGLTVTEAAIRYRVSEDRVRHWITSGQLRAINRRDTRCGRPSWVIPPESLIEFERGREATPPPKQARRKKQTTEIDFYPGD